MMWCRYLRLVPFLATLSCAPAAAGPAAGEHALSLDDACSSASGDSCAMHALQLGSLEAEKGSAARGAKQALVATEDKAREDPESDEWEIPESTIWDNWGPLLGDDLAIHLHNMTRFNLDYTVHLNITLKNNALWNGVANKVAPITLTGCPIWMTLFRPMVSFWSQELRRRVQAQPENISPENQVKLKHFAKVAGYFMCTTIMDPRSGAEFPEHVAAYWKKVRSLPSTSLEVPKLDPWFESVKDDLASPPGCMIWAVGMSCDLGYLTESLTGNKKSQDICWDQLRAPDSINGTMEDAVHDDRRRPEYALCEEHPLTHKHLDEYCPMHGKYPDGLWNVSSWGGRPPSTSEVYNDVLTCQRKIGFPQSDFPTAAALDAYDLGLL